MLGISLFSQILRPRLSFENKKWLVLLCGGSKITKQPQKSENWSNWDRFEAFLPGHYQFFMKYFTFSKGPNLVISKLAIFQEFLLFPWILAQKIKEKDILAIKMSLKIEFGPPAEQNQPFLSFRDNLGRNVLRILGILPFFNNQCSTRISNFRSFLDLIDYFNLGAVY